MDPELPDPPQHPAAAAYPAGPVPAGGVPGRRTRSAPWARC
jgi:hypothetical protein